MMAAMEDELDRFASRLPDRVTYTEWEPVYGAERTKQVATDVRGFLFPYVHEYTEVKFEPVVDHRRIRTEYWDDPSRLVPVVEQTADGLVITGEFQAARHAARRFEEYESDIRAEDRRTKRLGI